MRDCEYQHTFVIDIPMEMYHKKKGKIFRILCLLAQLRMCFRYYFAFGWEPILS